MKLSLFLLFSVLIFVGCKKDSDLTPPVQTTPTTPDTPDAPARNTPIVSTDSISDLTLYSVVLSGKIVDTVGSELIERGFVVGTNPGPDTTNNFKKFISTPKSDGVFSTIVINIPPNKTWYVRAYGINSEGVGYGNEVKFTSYEEKAFSGEVILDSQEKVNEFGANNYTTIKGSLYIKGSVYDLKPLSSLVIVGNGFDIIGTQLKDLEGLENLEIVGNEFIHHFRIENNQSLTSLRGLESLKISQGTFYILNNDALVDLRGLDRFTTSANGEFRIDGCAKLMSINGLNEMRVIYGDIVLKDNPLLNDLQAWKNLSTVSGTLRVINNSALTNLDGFDNLREIEGVQIISNSSLREINGLKNLRIIPESILIDNNKVLTDLSAFANIKTTKYISIKNSNSLISLEGFNNIESTGSLRIQSNPKLQDMSGFGKLANVESLSILFNDGLITLSGLESLTSINHNSYSLTITGNRQLKNLDALNKLLGVDGGIQILSNRSLGDFCGLKPLFAADKEQSFLVQDNLINPDKNQILSSCP